MVKQMKKKKPKSTKYIVPVYGVREEIPQSYSATLDMPDGTTKTVAWGPENWYKALKDFQDKYMQDGSVLHALVINSNTGDFVAECWWHPKKP
jgi:hypothetical protein